MEHNGKTNTKANANDNGNGNGNGNGNTIRNELLPPGQSIMIGGYFLRRRNVNREQTEELPNNGRQSAGQLSDSPQVALLGGSQEGKKKAYMKDGANNKKRPRKDIKGCGSSTRKKPKFRSVEEIYTVGPIGPREATDPCKDGGANHVAMEPENNTSQIPEGAARGFGDREPLLNLDRNVAPTEEEEHERMPLNVDLNVAPIEEPERLAVLILDLNVVPPEELESPSTGRRPPLNIDLNLEPESPESMQEVSFASECSTQILCFSSLSQ